MTMPIPALSVLIVEDEAMIALMLEDFVESLGHSLHGVASSVNEGLDLVRKGGCDLAILDCNLAGEPVWPVADLLEERGIPFILSSGGSLADAPPRHQGRPLLEKPYTIGAISDLLARPDLLAAK